MHAPVVCPPVACGEEEQGGAARCCLAGAVRLQCRALGSGPGVPAARAPSRRSQPPHRCPARLPPWPRTSRPLLPPPPPAPGQILLYNANNYSTGLLSEILDFVMGQGLIPADGEVWRVRRR